jgi:hypothetical protein
MPRDPVHAWLLRLCDPVGVDVIPTTRLDPAGIARLLELADAHAVSGAVLANIGRITAAMGRERILQDAAGSTAAVESTISAARDRWFGLNVQSLILRQRTAGIVAALAGADVPAGVIKGEDFADRLYPAAGLRPFRDVDLMVPRGGMDAAAAAMASLGFREAGCGRHAGDYGERTWDSADRPFVRVDVHWNLINSPAQRRRSSLPTEAFPWKPAADGPPRRTTPAALLVIATVHAVLGHRFDRLQQLCDIRQVCRGAAGAVDVEWLREAAVRHGVETAVAGGLEVTARLLQDDATADIRRRFEGRGARRVPWRLLVHESTLLEPERPFARLRRMAVREWMKRAA